FEQAAYGDGPAAELGVRAVGIISRSRLAAREEGALVVAFLRATIPRGTEDDGDRIARMDAGGAGGGVARWGRSPGLRHGVRRLLSWRRGSYCPRRGNWASSRRIGCGEWQRRRTWTPQGPRSPEQPTPARERGRQPGRSSA